MFVVTVVGNYGVVNVVVVVKIIVSLAILVF